MIYVIMYLAAIVAANVSVSLFGPGVTIANAFLFIGFNLTARDHLHDIWNGRNLRRNMTLLILSGAAISALFGAGRIAAASFVAFAMSETVDAIIYQRLGGRAKLVQVNGSNVFSAAVDSVVFPALAFGWPLLWLVMVGQFAAKVFGGAVWALVLNRRVETKQQEEVMPNTK